jgi:hypothetical protein
MPAICQPLFARDYLTGQIQWIRIPAAEFLAEMGVALEDGLIKIQNVLRK